MQQEITFSRTHTAGLCRHKQNFAVEYPGFEPCPSYDIIYHMTANVSILDSFSLNGTKITAKSLTDMAYLAQQQD